MNIVETDFQNTLFEIKNIIKTSESYITPKTSFNGSGIYMIFIDNFTSDKIIPVYIGKSENVQKRYEQHYKEILALNHLSYQTYYEYFFCRGRNFYDGSFKTTKIFKYMVEHKCQLKDYKMLVLETCEKELLDIKEQYYIQKFKSEYFGFNQLNTRTLAPVYLDAIKKKNVDYIIFYYNKVLENIKSIEQYYNYGYTSFNYDYVFYRLEKFKLPIGSCIQELQEVNNELSRIRELLPFKKEHSLLEKAKEPLTELWWEIKRVENSKLGYELYQIENDLFKKVKHAIKPHKLYSGQELFIAGIEDNDSKKDFLDYVVKRGSTINPYRLLSKEISFYKKRKEEIRLNNEKIDKLVESLKIKYKIEKDKLIPLKVEIFKDIFPNIEFPSFVLKDNIIAEEYVFNEKCNVYIIMSNNARKKQPNIIRIDYTIDNKLYQYYVKSYLTDKICDGISYMEKNIDKPIRFMGSPPKPFEIVPMDSSVQYISSTVEYKYGMNDFTLKNEYLVELNCVLKQLKEITDKGITLSLKLSESKNVFEIAISDYDAIQIKSLFGLK